MSYCKMCGGDAAGCLDCVVIKMAGELLKERERCAKIAESHSCGDCHDTICNEEIAKKIREGR